MLRLSVFHNGRRHPEPLQASRTASVSDLRQQVAVHLSLPEHQLRLIASGKALNDSSMSLSETPLTDGATLYVLASAAAEVEAVSKAKPDPLVRPFGRPTGARYVGAPRRTRPPPGAVGASEEYGFGRVEALPGFADRDRATAILEGLCDDPGFLSVMRRKRWRVGALKEMQPDGRVGVDPVCVLGYNTNKGAEIHLRLRTDDRQGFRSMMSVRQVLAHELAHNEISEHNTEFKELMRWIEREADKADWRRSAGRALSPGWQVAQGTDGFDPLDESGDLATGRLNVVGKLGTTGSSSAEAGRSRLIESRSCPTGHEEVKDTDTEMKALPQSQPGGTVDTSDSLTSKDREKTAKPPLQGESGTIAATSPVTEAETVPAASEATSKAEPKPESRHKSPIDELTDMGFSSGLAQVALRENGRDATRAAHWLLSLSVQGPAPAGSAVGENERATAERVRSAIARLRTSGLSRDDLVSVLDALHLYLSNLLRNPGVERFTRINASNAAFRRRVGDHAAATALLSAAGFRLTDGFWIYTSRDQEPLWFTKSVVQDTLVQELGR